jgi:diadenosine tetraphosphate (Ap4A) HIT family hydrolase
MQATTCACSAETSEAQDRAAPEDCFLCGIIADRDDVPIRTIFSRTEMPSEALLKTEEFIVIADVAPVVPGHMLIFPVTHVSAISLLSPEGRGEIERLRGVISRALKLETGRASIAFEHGLCGTSGRDGCGIDHAHLHVLPSPGDVGSVMRKAYDCREVESLKDLPIMTSPGTQEYLVLIDERERCFYAEVRTPTRQFFRRVISEMLSNEFWNWHDQLILGDRQVSRRLVQDTRRMFTGKASLVDPERLGTTKESSGLLNQHPGLASVI